MPKQHISFSYICFVNDIVDLLTYQSHQDFVPSNRREAIKESLVTWTKGHRCRRNAAVEGIQDSSSVCGWPRDKDRAEVKRTRSEWAFCIALERQQLLSSIMLWLRGMKIVEAGSRRKDDESSSRASTLSAIDDNDNGLTHPDNYNYSLSHPKRIPGRKHMYRKKV